MKKTGLFSKPVLAGLAVAAGVFFLFVFINKTPVIFKSPNIILFAVDTLRADHLSCYGYYRKTSPNIDAFSKNSVLFQNAISQAPVTAPAFMSIFTSLTPLVHLIECNLFFYDDDVNKVNVERLDERIQTLPLLLKKNGYLTMGFTQKGNVTGAIGFDKGFDVYDTWKLEKPWGLRNGLEDVRKAVQKSKQTRKPLFLFLHNYICHAPYLGSPSEFNLKFLSERTAGLPASADDLPGRGNDSGRHAFFWKNVDLGNPRHRNHVIALYDGSISYEDHVFGKVMELLKKEDFYDDSIVILVSDHGEEFYEHLGKEHSRLFIETLHVPLIIKFPRNMFGARVIRAWVRTMDIMPTLFAFLGIKIENIIQGISFKPLITGKGKYRPFVVSYANNAGINSVGFVDGTFAYSNQPTGDVDEWLFDIREDPLEKNNLAAAREKVLERMRPLAEDILEKNRIVRERIGFQLTRSVQKNDGLSSELRSLGYQSLVDNPYAPSEEAPAVHPLRQKKQVTVTSGGTGMGSKFLLSNKI